MNNIGPNWLPTNVPTQQDRNQMGQAVGSMVLRHYGPSAVSPFNYHGQLRPADNYSNIVNGQIKSRGW